MASRPGRPRWLDDEDEIISLLHNVVDRFDQLAGHERSQRIIFPAESSLPSLKQLNQSADQIWLLIGELKKLYILDIKQTKRSLLDAPWSSAKLAFFPDAEATLRDWLDRPAMHSELKIWRELVNQHAGVFPGDISALMRRRLMIPGYTDKEIIEALAGIARFREPVTLRQMSSALFRGDSKVLDEREDLIRTLYPDLPIRQRAIIVAIHLPEIIEGILFIENQESYVAASEGSLLDTGQLALVYTAGFRSGAVRIREKGGAKLHYSGTGIERWRVPLEMWWFTQRDWHLPLYFFGDLDFSGMQILSVLRRRFGEVAAWRPGYERLMGRVIEGGGHAPDAADKQLQNDPGETGCHYADRVLLPTMRNHGFLDQEALLPDLII